MRAFPDGPVAKTLHFLLWEPESIPGQGIRSHMLHLRVCMLQLKIPACYNKDKEHATPRRRPGAAKQTNKQKHKQVKGTALRTHMPLTLISYSPPHCMCVGSTRKQTPCIKS